MTNPQGPGKDGGDRAPLTEQGGAGSGEGAAMDDEGYREMGDIVAEMDCWLYGTPPDGWDAAAQAGLPPMTWATPAVRLAMLARQRAVLARGPGDPALSVVARFEAGVLANALFCGDLALARDLVERRFPPGTVARGAPMDSAHDVQRMAVCVLAMLKEDDRALALMEALGREGDDQFWRFDIRAERSGNPYGATGMDRWLDRLSGTPAYGAILDRYRPRWGTADGRFVHGPLRMVEEAILGGKARKTCVLSGRRIEPGTPVIRFRRAFEGERNEMQLAARDAFEESPLQAARHAFEANAVPLAKMFPPLAVVPDRIRAPAIARFLQDMADGAAFDPLRAATLITRPDRRPISFMLEDESRDYLRGLPDWHGAEGHGAAGDLLWRLIRAGQFPALAEAAATLPDADVFFALAACYDDPAIAAQAARHFGLPDLPRMVDLALGGRARPAVAVQLADYGAAQPRWRRAIALAMERHALNLYSAYVPSVNWFLAGWDRFTRAHGTSLMYFCTDTPEDIPALARMLATGRLIRGDGGSRADCYSVCGPIFYQVALLHLARNDPAGLRRWLGAEWMTRRRDDPADRAMRRFVSAAARGTG